MLCADDAVILWNVCLTCNHPPTRTHTHTCTHTHTSMPDPDVRTKDNLTPLHVAACYLTHFSDQVTEADGASDGTSTGHQVIQMLLEAHGKSAIERLVVGQRHTAVIGTPLHMAVSRGSVSAVQELLKHIQSTLPIAVHEVLEHCWDLDL